MDSVSDVPSTERFLGIFQSIRMAKGKATAAVTVANMNVREIAIEYSE